MHLTKFIITNHPPYRESQKSKASKMLDSFKWNQAQRSILECIKARGYFIGKYNDARKTFGMPIATGGDKKEIMAISIGKRKRDLQIYSN